MGIFQILKDDLTLKIYTQILEISYYFLFFSNNKILEKKNSKFWVIPSKEFIVMKINVRGKRATDYTYYGFILEQAYDNKEYSYNYINTYQYFQHKDHKC